ncbi:MAG: PPC domain-containing protein [Treponema sp.]|nr:PPC domain-containing protein [Treponema sp.]MCL2251545.1 PPC domain-containing protein [Treponema sp.]
MKKYLLLISIFFILVVFVFAQEEENPVMKFDEAVSALAKNIHAKLIEKKADKLIIGQFTFQEAVPHFSAYWVNQLTDELTNMSGRNYAIYSSNTTDIEWTITGEIVQVANIIRIYTTLVRLSETSAEGSRPIRSRIIEASFNSSFQREEHINAMISASSGGGSNTASAGRDAREPDSWENPVPHTIGTGPNAPVINRTLTEGDEDFFLLVPERDGRLTVETTGSIDTFLVFFNYEDEEELASNDDGGQGSNAKITHNVRAGVRYVAIVRGYGSSTTGAYGFKAYLAARENSSSWENPFTYELGAGEENAATVNRTIQEGDEDFFLIVPSRGGRITIETTGRMDTYMELFDANSKEMLDDNDDSGSNYNARIRYVAEAGSRYIVMVRGYDSSAKGSYGFRAFFQTQNTLSPDNYEPNNEPSEATPIEIGSAQEHTFHSKDDVDWFTFQITNAGQYVINTKGLTSNRLDTYIELYDSNLNSIAEDDDGGNALSSLLSQNLNRGTYLLKVWCLDEEPDQGYSISINKE